MKSRRVFLTQTAATLILSCMLALVCLYAVFREDKGPGQEGTGERVERAEEAGDAGNGETSITDVWEPRYSYYLELYDLSHAAFAYHDGEVEFDGYPIYVPAVSIPGDSQKEERINRMMVERYLQLLPLTTEEDWDELMRPRITYRSDRYLCFRYMPMTYLPENCDHRDLYFTLDLEKERWVEYPAVYEGTGKKVLTEYDGLYQLIQEYMETDGDPEIYVTYESWKWLSFVYYTAGDSDSDSNWHGRIKRSGVTIDLESGEITGLDGLFETDKLSDWMCVNGIYGKEWYNGFYLNEGKLVVMRPWPLTDKEIPLPEVYEYLKVDPWYN